jgi:hypothetical protein
VQYSMRSSLSFTLYSSASCSILAHQKLHFVLLSSLFTLLCHVACCGSQQDWVCHGKLYSLLFCILLYDGSQQ